MCIYILSKEEKQENAKTLVLVKQIVGTFYFLNHQRLHNEKIYNFNMFYIYKQIILIFNRFRVIHQEVDWNGYQLKLFTLSLTENGMIYYVDGYYLQAIPAVQFKRFLAFNNVINELYEMYLQNSNNTETMENTHTTSTDKWAIERLTVNLGMKVLL